METFAFDRPQDLGGVLAAIAEPGSFPIAGGTELLNWMKEGIVVPKRVVDINRLPGLDGIEAGATGLRIGALARMSDVAGHVAVRRDYPAIAEALTKSASPQLRNMASLGGNLLQRTRCPYFRAEVDLPCNKRHPGSGCAAREGEDRAMAVFGWSESCLATHPSDVAVAFAALDASVEVAGPAGTRSIPLSEFHRLPDDAPERETSLQPGELIVAIVVPASALARRSHYLKIRERASYEFALVSAAVGVELEGDRIAAARIALGGVAPKPWRLAAAEENLRGVTLEASALRAAIEDGFADAAAKAQRFQDRARQADGGASDPDGRRDRMNGGIGQPVSRLDGRAKVTGTARYAADVFVTGVLHAVPAPSPIPKGTITAIDTAAAERSPGVIRVLTHANAAKLAAISDPPAGQNVLPLQGDRIAYEGQPIALVVADSLERATAAARLVRAKFRAEPFTTDFLVGLDRGEALPSFGVPADASHGDIGAALSNAEVRLAETYLTSDRHHNAMEPSATLAVWRDDRLTLYDSVQGVVTARTLIAQALQLDPSRVRVISDYVGGGFGCKGWVWSHQLLAAMAARELGRPVKLVETRAQAYTDHGYQPASRQTVTLAAKADGALAGIQHDSILAGSHAGQHVEPAGWGTHAIYASPAIATTHRLVRVDRGNPTPMRAPIEGVGQVAVEGAMDELAYKLGMDPLALRLKNYAESDPFDGRPFSSKKLRECYSEGARRFGWSERNPAPRSMRDGHDLVGYGMATALMQTFRNPAKARVTIDRSGKVLVATSTQEIGTGVRTIMPQIAADALGVPVESVDIHLGDTDLPPAPMTAGSSSTASTGSAVHDAATKLKRQLDQAGNRYDEALAKLGVESLSADGEYTPGNEKAAIYAFGAVFVEVRVDEEIPIPRVRRVVGVYSAGRIINPKTARSQITGGMIWGIGQALLEKSEMDHKLGRFLSKNLAGYLVPVNADVPDLDASFVEEYDPIASPIGARGIGELAATGIGPAIANAVFHATGVRVRELPIRLETLMAGV